MPAPAIIHELVAKFEENYDLYHSSRYNEAQLRLEFLDPFFEALGWDVKNTRGISPNYREVVVEDSIKIEGHAKAPDYAFRVGPERKFFVEAKKPAVDVATEKEHAFQVRRYAWNAHLSLSILTDFEELAVYNTTNRPQTSDSVATAREKLYHYSEYIEKWDEIASIFSRDAVWKGAFDRFAESSKGKKGTTRVDDAFLADIEEWRLNLARNIALRNEFIQDEEQLNYAVQMTIDRIIFLRICEDRGIEGEEQLLRLTENPDIYQHLLEIYQRADIKYNSGLFHFQEEAGNASPVDTFTPRLTIDDKVLKEIIKSIYYPCPYIFKEIPVEILGQVYEQFLGSVIRLTAGHRAKVEQKPEVRKAGGVYYTPRYIVDYIVENTVGKLLEGKNPAQAESLTIVDPACGSGSFLLGAYQYLLDWHLKWYMENDPDKWMKGKNPALIPAAEGGYKLTGEKKKEILVNNLYGVDIDAQAVEVTKLSLLLKVLEGESGQLSLGLERVLPDLSRNIQCGNSLIGNDYFAGQLLPDPAERRRVNPFEWRFAFPHVFARGGFDAVIGNPPYGASFDSSERKFLKSYEVGTTDSAALMMVRGVKIVNNHGLIGFIVPKPFLYSSTWEKTRELLLPTITSITDVSKAWKEVLLEQIIYIQSLSSHVDAYDSFIAVDKQFEYVCRVNKQACKFFGFIINDLSSSEISLAENIWKDSDKLTDFVTNTRGGMFQKQVTTEGQYEVLGGKNISRYGVTGNKGYCDSNIIAEHPKAIIEPGSLLIQNIIAHIKKPTPHIKIIGLQTDELSRGSYLILDTINQLTNKSVLNSSYILGILHSKLMNWYVYRFIFAKAIRTMHFDGPTTDKIPIRKIDLKNKTECNTHDRMVALVERMLALHKQSPLTPQEEAMRQREIASTDRQIDALVYELYGLTEEEIKIVENG